MIIRYIFILYLLVVTVSFIFAEDLKSGRYEIIQSWSQENSFPRPFWVRVPPSMEGQVMPLFIFLHGLEIVPLSAKRAYSPIRERLGLCVER